MRGKPGHNTQPHTRLPPNHLDIDARMTLKLNRALICKLCGSFMCLDYFLTCYPCVVVQLGTGRRPVDWCRNTHTHTHTYTHTHTHIICASTQCNKLHAKKYNPKQHNLFYCNKLNDNAVCMFIYRLMTGV